MASVWSFFDYPFWPALLLFFSGLSKKVLYYFFDCKAYFLETVHFIGVGSNTLVYFLFEIY